MSEDRYLLPDWPAPEGVRAFVTLRTGGYSQGAFSSFNLGLRSGDDPDVVAKNRALLGDNCHWRHRPQWLKQVHGTDVVAAQPDNIEREGDAVWTDKQGLPCAVLTADCLPVIFCNSSGTRVAVSHAGWKGLQAGVLEATVKAMGDEPGQLMAWLGPAISQSHFEVGPEVRDAFLNSDPQMETAFIPGQSDRWYGDLYELARLRLQKLGVTQVSGGNFCTYEEDDRWFSYRRDGVQSGRLATMVWIE
ncbi:peptidoglycan editing factor PgeF [Endozoicomonas sp. 8E]|uniref:peptidoglycan editing factor PgeF n=1 Tax=Endozoicomonas sp. 8E TaxID=3035692 RepID=UPI002939356A|nr:peptidoglycan editing factor PgeF [Endozoicomonas sp. 8E]WOG26160.1 peptidoglycan editing factor PgeF [Endozoicomonas sp. 8E]